MGELLPTPPVILSTSPDVVNNPKTAGPETVVRLQALDGTWETCGVDRAKGIFPENVSLTSDSWGPKTATFDLRRDGTAIWPDVLAFTPVKIEVNGQLVWSGRVSDTPSRDGADTTMSIQCEGWQHHLDDDMMNKVFVRRDMGDWKDVRTFRYADVAVRYFTAPTVTQDTGLVTLAFQAGQAVPHGSAAAIGIDLGASFTADRITVVYDAANPVGAGVYFNVDTSTDEFGPWSTSGGTGGVRLATVLGSGATYTAPITGARTIMLRLHNATGSSFTPATDVYARIREIILYGKAAYEGSDTSVLKASTVIGSALGSCPLLSSDQSMIQAPLTALPSYAPSEDKTPREHVNAVNGMHGWTTKVDAFRRMNFYSKPLRPKYDVGSYSYMETSDSAGSSSGEIYNKVIVTGSDPAGQAVKVTRYSIDLATAVKGAASETTWTNPSFDDTSIAAWSVPGIGSFTRTTTGGEYDTAPGAGKLTGPTGQVMTTSITATGTSRPGTVYEVSFRLKQSSSSGISVGVTLTAGTSVVSSGALSATTSYQTFSYKIMPTTSPITLALEFYNATGSGASVFIDGLELKRCESTLADRRGATRAFNLQVNSVLPSDGVLAAALGDAWLDNHITTTFKGDVTLTGQQSLRDRLSGQPVPLYDLLANTDELMFFSDRPNPDSGGHGRTARISSVTYTPADDKAVVTLDNSRTNFDVLLNRLGAT